MEDVFHDMKRNGVIRPCFADAARENEAKDSAARFLVGAHGAEQSRRRNARPGRQRSQAANQGDDTGNVVRAGQAEFVPEEGGGDHAPRYGFTVPIAAGLLSALWSMCGSVERILG